MNCDLCCSPLRRTKAYSIYEDFFDNSNRLVDIIERYLQMKVKTTDSQSSLICQSCYTHLDDFHKFALLIKEKQELLTNDIPTIKLDDSDEDEEQEASYIRDTDVLVEFKTEDGVGDGEDELLMETNEMHFPQDDLLMVSETMNDFHNNSNFCIDSSMSMSSFEQMSWHGGHDIITKAKTPAKLPRKTPYKTHTPEDRARIVEAANRGDDWSALASELGVKYKTAYTWVSTSRKEMFMRNGKNNTFTENNIDTIIQWIEENRQITLKEIVAKVKVLMRKEVCVYFVEGSLEGRLYRHKRSLDYHPQLINTLENKKKRLEYVNTLKYYMDLKKTVVWVGETNFKMFCRRAKGRFNTNSTFATFDPTIYVMGAITTEGVIGIQRSRNRIRPDDIFTSWLHTKTESLTNLVIVCDSDYCFSELDEYFNNSEVTLLLLSPYSYMLNPMEAIWDNIMSSVKKNPLMSNTNQGDVKEQRLGIAEKCIDQVITTISAEYCNKAIKKSNKYHTDILDLQDMPVK
ncbi:uncharacterized protein LOC111681245 [Lucilia cuprina]|uniref:uncharacterized protein LOC111681245 n=1 Tax=Lucilia cuprina TaxID=7375 RepID=UPI001F061C76|nr:uncharacterized protein LOC111681245 [Lucilia cuprina]